MWGIVLIIVVVLVLLYLDWRRRSFTFHVTVDQPQEPAPMTTNLTLTQRTTVRLARITDRRGRPAPIDGTPSWSAEGNIDILVAEDGLSCRVTPTDVGSGQVTVTADARIGEGVETISHTEFFSITPAQAANLETSVDTPEEIPDDELPEDLT